MRRRGPAKIVKVQVRGMQSGIDLCPQKREAYRPKQFRGRNMPIRRRGYRIGHMNFTKDGKLSSMTFRRGRVTQTFKNGKVTTSTNLGFGRSYVTTSQAPSIGQLVIAFVVVFALAIAFFAYFSH
jgi:hypothetical protein